MGTYYYRRKSKMENSNINIDALSLIAKYCDYREKTAISCTCQDAYEETKRELEEIRTTSRTAEIFDEIFNEEYKDMGWMIRIFGANPSDVQLEWCGKVYDLYEEFED